MNGVITYDDGAGTVIENGKVTTKTFSTTNFNADNIQGIAPDDDITLFTDTSSLASIQLGGATTGTTFIDGNVVLVNGTNTLDLTAGALMDFRSPTLKLNQLVATDPVYACDVKIVTNKVEPNTVANGLAIGSTITSANLTLGNATYPPSCAATATSANHICNYATVNSLIAAGGSLLTSNNTWSGSNRFNTTLQSAYIFQTDTIDPLVTTSGSTYYLYGSVPAVSYIYFGSVISTSTSEVYINPNNGLVNIGVGSSRSASVNINSGPNCSGSVNILTGSSNTGTLNLASSPTYSGTVNICTQSINPNNIFMGVEGSTTIRMRGTTNINTVGSMNTNIQTGSNNGTLNLGNSSSTTTMLGTTNINTTGAGNTNINTAGNVGNIFIGNSASVTQITGRTNINTTVASDTVIGGAGGFVGITSVGGLSIIGGVTMGGSNVTVPWKICFGVDSSTAAVNAGAYSAAQTTNYGVTFSGSPQVYITVMKNPNNSWAAVAAYFKVAIDTIGTSSFTWSVNNTAGGTNAAANSYWINWFAIGPY